MLWHNLFMPITRRTARSIGWQTPEQERRARIARAVDMIVSAS